MILWIGGFFLLCPRLFADEQKILYQTGLATLYDFPGDKYSGQHIYACERRLKKAVGDTEWQKMLAYGVAHRTLPCGSKVYVCTASSIKRQDPKCIYVYVVDRGPYGALNQKNEWFVRARLLPGERWRGIMDLRPSVANLLEFNGLEKILLYKDKSKE